MKQKITARYRVFKLVSLSAFQIGADTSLESRVFIRTREKCRSPSIGQARADTTRLRRADPADMGAREPYGRFDLT